MAKNLPPIHPGAILREEFMNPLELPGNALARDLDATPAHINEIVHEKRGIGADTARRLARFLRTDVQSWMNLEPFWAFLRPRFDRGTINHLEPSQRRHPLP